MITRIVKLTFTPERLPDFLYEFEQVKNRVVNSEGCVTMKLLQHQSNPCEFFTYSIWVDENALENYRCSETFIQLWGTIKPWFASKAEAWTLDTRFEGVNEHVKKN
ncbi:MAG: putative quinol monooxygenase [Flavobacteriales bacterium]